jgi:hypothetical protein
MSDLSRRDVAQVGAPRKKVLSAGDRYRIERERTRADGLS